MDSKYMIKFVNKSQCMGCSACASICPKGCITMQSDEEGFLYPIVDSSICIECHLCEQKCPIINPFEKRKPLKCYAAQNKNEHTRIVSSSGGVFTIMALDVLDKGGIVCGVEFDANMMTHHVCIQTKEDLPRLVGSKYLQSRIENVFTEIKGYLRGGRLVLFIGTPCQVAGINRFLGNLALLDNFISVELCCHGVPSPFIWKKYLNETVIDTSKIKKITFRSKTNGWKNYSLDITAENYHLCEGKEQNVYMQGFLKNLYCRPICSECKTRSFATGSDISIGDFWGLSKYYPQFDDNKGKSLILLLTDKGKGVFEQINDGLYFFLIKYEEVILGNTNYLKSSPMHIKRNYFWRCIKNDKSVSYSVLRCLDTPILLKMRNYIKNIICRK